MIVAIAARALWALAKKTKNGGEDEQCPFNTVILLYRKVYSMTQRERKICWKNVRVQYILYTTKIWEKPTPRLLYSWFN